MFNISVFIGGIKGEDQSLIQSQNPQLSGETHNRTRLLSCTRVSHTISYSYFDEGFFVKRK